ncbi:MAG: aspartate kinase [Ruminococcus sp.]|jgi:aspartate kinase|nr:aspartate kinase [Ruminococcus sp.]
MKTVKFGGSSMADAIQFSKVRDIVLADEKRRIVVVSAPGKRDKNDSKVTDMLYDCYAKAARGIPFADEFAAIEERYNAIIRDLNLDISLDEEFENIKDAFAHRAGRDYAASRGEYLNGLLFAKYIGFEFIEPASCIFFNDNGVFDPDATYPVLSERLKKAGRAVIPGFYGAMPNDTIKTFSRGGSDITGSIAARASGSEIYENWTDVSGFLVADPRIVENPEPIETITYKELRELSYMGAGVLHEEAIFPVRTAGIPINIRNTNKPSDKGTLIVDEAKDGSRFTITGIAGKKGFSVINIEKDLMNAEIGFGRNVLRALEKSNLSFEHMPSGVDTMSVIISTDALKPKQTDVIDEIRERVHPDVLTVEDNLALIAVVGRGMKRTRGTAGRIFSALAHANVNVKMIDQGSSEINVIIGVAEDDFETAVNAVYDIFVKTVV